MERDELMDQVRAARAAIDSLAPISGDRRDELELRAFMAIFHPDHPATRTGKPGRQEGDPDGQ